MELYAGLDLHSRDTYIGIMDKAFNRVFEKRVPNHLEHILPTRAPFQDQIEGFVVESTDEWYRLVDGLMDAGYSSAHLANSCRMESGHANYLIIYKKSSKNGRFPVLSIPFWVQNNRGKDSFWSPKEWFKTILEPILNSVAVIMAGYRGPIPIAYRPLKVCWRNHSFEKRSKRC